VVGRKDRLCDPCNVASSVRSGSRADYAGHYKQVCGWSGQVLEEARYSQAWLALDGLGGSWSSWVVERPVEAMARVVRALTAQGRVP
jgi:hypothetical protein